MGTKVHPSARCTHIKHIKAWLKANAWRLVFIRRASWPWILGCICTKKVFSDHFWQPHLIGWFTAFETGSCCTSVVRTPRLLSSGIADQRQHPAKTFIFLKLKIFVACVSEYVSVRHVCVRSPWRSGEVWDPLVLRVTGSCEP